MKRSEIKFGDISIFLFALALGVFFLVRSGRKLGRTVIVHADENLYKYDLNVDGVYEVAGAIGATKIEIKSGCVRVLDSCCPNKICVQQGFSPLIVCLPNQVVVEVQTNDSKTEALDAVSK